jgi:hypothetical protein
MEEIILILSVPLCEWMCKAVSTCLPLLVSLPLPLLKTGISE